METPAFISIKTFLKETVFESPNTPDLFFNAESAANLEISIDVQSRVAEESSLYLVELHTSLTPKIDERVVFNLRLIYSTLVEITDKEMDDETRKYLLTVIVPQSMYNPLRALVWKLTLESGFPPIMMNDYDFAAHQASTDIRPFDNHEVSFDKNEDNDNSFASEVIDRIIAINDGYNEQLKEYNERLQRVNDELVTERSKVLLLEDKAGREGLYLNEINGLKTDNEKLKKFIALLITLLVFLLLGLTGYITYNIAVNNLHSQEETPVNVQSEASTPVSVEN